MRLRSASQALAIAAVCSVGAAGARADDSLATSVTASGGWTDNILGAPDNPTDTDPPLQSDMFTQLSPGLVFSQETRRLIQVASYTFSANLFSTHSEANSYSNQLSWQAIYSMSAVSELNLGANASNGRLNTFNTQNPANTTMLDQLPNGGVSFVSADLSEGYRRELSRAWTTQQRTQLRLFEPTSDTTLGTNFYWTNNVGIDHAWREDSLGASLRLDYTLFGTGTASDGTMLPSNKQVTVGPEVRYLHDFTRNLSGELSGGGVMVSRVGSLHHHVAQPVATVALRYVREGGRAEVGYRHSVAPNIFVAQTTAADELFARGGLPIPLIPRAVLSGSVGYQRAHIIDTDASSLIGTTKLLLADVAISWQPSRSWTVSMRYQRFAQLRSDIAADTSRSFSRNQVLLSLSGRYPSREAAVLPDRADIRVDRSDEKGLGQTDTSNPSVDSRDLRR